MSVPLTRRLGSTRMKNCRNQKAIGRRFTKDREQNVSAGSRKGQRLLLMAVTCSLSLACVIRRTTHDSLPSRPCPCTFEASARLLKNDVMNGVDFSHHKATLARQRGCQSSGVRLPA